ncbi:Sre G protein-coupled chemoreceptor [Oesophagostomum dentatum]|uniref:Sre G protein-coupled chemoreceptor n=1 Tax=Oesophagostomum dentatum TaxID=61180 RepID=A0A0B1TL40_OESDE|nr:Sre G protein-coupled chemoreceptor [Oesophagostomum dentatum]
MANLAVHLIAVTLSEVSRVLILFYEAGLVETRGSFDRVLFILFIVRFVFICMLLTLIPAVIAERTFASKYISDYESVHRSWISYLVNGTSLVISVIYYILIQLEGISGVYSLICLTVVCLLTMTLSSCAILMVHRSDLAKLRDISSETGRSTIHYTLSMKFQLAENVRVTKLLTCASVGFSVWGTVSCFLSATGFVILGEAHPVSQLLYAIVNVYIAVSLAVVVWISLAAIGELQRFLKGLSKHFCCLSRYANRRVIFPAIPIPHDPHVATEKYFSHLQSAWTTRIP